MAFRLYAWSVCLGIKRRRAKSQAARRTRPENQQVEQMGIGSWNRVLCSSTNVYAVILAVRGTLRQATPFARPAQAGCRRPGASAVNRCMLQAFAFLHLDAPCILRPLQSLCEACECMWIYIYMHIHTHTYVHKHIHTCMHTCMHTGTYVYSHTATWKSAKRIEAL